MSFDGIPEDIELSYSCPAECGGNAIEKIGVWQCDNCDWCCDKNENLNGDL